MGLNLSHISIFVTKLEEDPTNYKSLTGSPCSPHKAPLPAKHMRAATCDKGTPLFCPTLPVGGGGTCCCSSRPRHLASSSGSLPLAQQQLPPSEAHLTTHSKHQVHPPSRYTEKKRLWEDPGTLQVCTGLDSGCAPPPAPRLPLSAQAAGEDGQGHHLPQAALFLRPKGKDHGSQRRDRNVGLIIYLF